MSNYNFVGTIGGPMNKYKVTKEWARLKQESERRQAKAVPTLLLDYMPVEQGPKLIDWLEGLCLVTVGVLIIIGLMCV